MTQPTSQDLVFKAPWGKPLMWTTWTCTIVLVGLTAFLLFMKVYIVAVVPCLILAFTAPFTIRRYTICADQLVVRRLFSNTIVDLSNLQSIYFNPKALANSTRSAGNGGLFSFSGYFTSKELGDYRALFTNSDFAVVLKFPMETVVVSPENPQSFVKMIRQFSVNA